MIRLDADVEQTVRVPNNPPGFRLFLGLPIPVLHGGVSFIDSMHHFTARLSFSTSPPLPFVRNLYIRVFRASPRYHPKLYFMVQNVSGNIANAFPALLHSFWWPRGWPTWRNRHSVYYTGFGPEPLQKLSGNTWYPSKSIGSVCGMCLENDNFV